MIVDLFAGPGGVSEGLRMLGLSDVGVEWDAAACATRAAAGHLTIRADVATYPPDHLAGHVEGLAMSPPCTTFSAAGKGEGRVHLARLVAAVHAGAWGGVDPTRAAGYGHVLEVGRWVETLRPEWVACEQVPEVLPVWRAYAERWRVAGWSTWAGVLNSADFGVPQTRKRAFLLASRVRPVGPPVPTHARTPEQTLFGPALEPWVSMAEALGWAGDNVDRPARTLCGDRSPRWLYPDRDGSHGAVVVRATQDHPETYCSECATYDPRGGRPGPWHSRPCSMWEPGLVLNRRQNSRAAGGGSEPVRLAPADEPAPTLTGIAGAKGQWVWEQPATTIAGDPRITARCHHDEGSQGRDAKSTDQVQAGDYEGTEPIKLTLTEALTLQSFRPDYPVRGTKTAQFRQVGDAVPPLLAAAVVGQLVGKRVAVERDHAVTDEAVA